MKEYADCYKATEWDEMRGTCSDFPDINDTGGGKEISGTWATPLIMILMGHGVHVGLDLTLWWFPGFLWPKCLGRHVISIRQGSYMQTCYFICGPVKEIVI